MANREILFRGQTRRKGEKVWMDGRPVDSNWVYGGVLQGTGAFSVMYGCSDLNDIRGATIDKHVVYTDTLGQYTGLTDKNGKKIFEGDILTYPDSSCFGVVCLGDYDHFDTKHTGFFVKWFENGKQRGFRLDIRFWLSQEAWVVGNIHDNPDLIKGGAE